MREVRFAIRRLHHARTAGPRACLLFTGNGIDGPQREQVLVRFIHVGEIGVARPTRSGAQSSTGLDRLLLTLGDEADKAPVTYDRDHSRHCLGRRFVQILELCAITRRPHHPAMQHARQPNVLNVGGTAGDLGRDIQSSNGLSHDLVARCRLRRDLRGGLTLEIERLNQFAIADLAAVGRGDRAVRNGQLICRCAEPLRCEIDQDRAHFGGSHAQCRAAVFDREAARCMALVRRLARVARDHLDPGQRQIEFFGHDLRERGEDALPQLHLAGENGRAAIGIDADPSVEPAIVLQTSGQSLLPARKLGLEREADDDRTESGGELAATENGSVHAYVLPLACAARSTARMMRAWVPQRQRLSASAARTSASLGRGLRSSSSFADMIMPLMQ